MTTFYDPHGLHLVELFVDRYASDFLPGLMPEGDDPGEDWDESLVADFPHLKGEG